MSNKPQSRVNSLFGDKPNTNTGLDSLLSQDEKEIIESNVVNQEPVIEKRAKISPDLPESAYQLIKMGPYLPKIDVIALNFYKTIHKKDLQEIIGEAVRQYIPDELYHMAEDEILKEERKKAEELLAKLNRK